MKSLKRFVLAAALAATGAVPTAGAAGLIEVSLTCRRPQDRPFKDEVRMSYTVAGIDVYVGRSMRADQTWELGSPIPVVGSVEFTVEDRDKGAFGTNLLAGRDMIGRVAVFEKDLVEGSQRSYRLTGHGAEYFFNVSVVKAWTGPFPKSLIRVTDVSLEPSPRVFVRNDGSLPVKDVRVRLDAVWALDCRVLASDTRTVRPGALWGGEQGNATFKKDLPRYKGIKWVLTIDPENRGKNLIGEGRTVSFGEYTKEEYDRLQYEEHFSPEAQAKARQKEIERARRQGREPVEP